MAHLRTSTRFGRCLMRLARHQYLMNAGISSGFLPGQALPLSSDDTVTVFIRPSFTLYDQVDIEELSTIIKRASEKQVRSADAADNSISSSSKPGEPNSVDLYLLERLQNCTNTKDVLKLLEALPGDQLSTHSAAFALQRMYEIQRQDCSEDDGNQSLIERAIMKLLYDRVFHELAVLNAQTFIGIVSEALDSSSIPKMQTRLLMEEFERRIDVGAFTVEELCSLIEVQLEARISTSSSSNTTTLTKLWNHLIQERIQDISSSNVAKVFTLLNSSNGLVELPQLDCVSLSTAIRNSCEGLNSVDFVTILNEVARCDIEVLDSSTKQSLLSSVNTHWLGSNIQCLTDPQMKSVLRVMGEFKFSDRKLIKTLEKFLVSHMPIEDKSVIGEIMNYCLSVRYISDEIFDAVAVDIQNNGPEYDNNSLFYALRPFGHLNYLPPLASTVFGSVEKLLKPRITSFQPQHLIELLASFVYLGFLPVNLMRTVFSPRMLLEIEGLEKSLSLKTKQHGAELWVALRLRDRMYFMPSIRFHPHHPRESFTPNRSADRTFMKFRDHVDQVLLSLLPRRKFQWFFKVPRCPFTADVLILVGSDGTPRNLNTYRGRGLRMYTKIGLILDMPSHYSSNTGTLLGQEAFRRHCLTKLGFKLIEVPYVPGKSSDQLAVDLKELLQEHIRGSIFMKRSQVWTRLDEIVKVHQVSQAARSLEMKATSEFERTTSSSSPEI